MAKNFNDTQVDNRTFKLNLQRGKLTREEYAAYLKSLPDLSANADEIPAYEEPTLDMDSSSDLTFSVN